MCISKNEDAEFRVASLAFFKAKFVFLASFEHLWLFWK